MTAEDDFFDDWLPLDQKALPDPADGPFLTTNSSRARLASGRPSHVFLTSMFHADETYKGPVMCFTDDMRPVWTCYLYKPVFGPRQLKPIT